MKHNYPYNLWLQFLQGICLAKNVMLFFGVLFFMLFSSLSVVGQSTVTPSYEWLKAVSFGTVTQAETSGLTIAIATDSKGNVYRLTFGDGVLKYSSDGIFIKKIIQSGQLNDPLDIALDSNDNIYVIDYEDQAPFSDNGKIKKFTSLGVEIIADRILTSYFRPLGLTLDKDDNIYVVIYNDGSGAESTISSELRVYNKNGSLLKKTEGPSGHTLSEPYRIGVDSKKNIYISHTANDGEVLVLNSSYQYLTTLAGMGSPGSVVVDEFDFIHVVDYSNRINFSQLLNYNNLSAFQAVIFALEIQEGINNKEFGIRIYDKNRVLQAPFFKDHLELPVDIAFNSCDRMYVDNANITELNLFFQRIKIEFELEIYKRTPSFDTEKPLIVNCVPDQMVTLTNGEFRLPDYTGLAVFNAIDNCDTDLTLTQAPLKDAIITGTTTVTITATDDAGLSASCTFQVIIETATDTEKPVITCPASITKNVDSGECGAIVTFGDAIATDNSGAAPTIARIDDNTGLTSGDLFPVGLTTITFRATDEGGNFKDCSFTITISDTENPTILCPDSITETVAFGETGKVITYDTLSFGDNCSGSTIAQPSGFPSGSEFPLGKTTNTFEVTDSSGNTAICSFDVTITESADTEDPVITCPASITKNVDSGKCGAVVSFADATATDNSGVAPTITRIVDNTSLTSGDLFPVGTTTITFRATDQAGNFKDCSFTITISDTENPTISCPASITETVPFGETGKVITYAAPSFDDNCLGSTLTQTFGLPSGSEFPLGNTTNTFEVTDVSGNTAICSFDVTITETTDTEKPVITCPASITKNVDSGECGAIVTFADATATDNSGVVPTISRIDNNTGLTTGDLFPVGLTTITFRATDEAGNFKDCSFTITISDTENPTISCPDSITETVPFGETGKVITYDAPSFGDNCSGSTITQTSGLPSGSEFPLGKITNTFEVTDASGNTVTCSFDVTITESTDTEDPVITCPINITRNIDTGKCGAVVAFSDATASDDSGNVTITLISPLPSGSEFPVGISIVTFEAKDGAGNTSACSFEIKILDNTPPTVNCPQEIIVEYSTEKSYTVPDFSSLYSSSDNCSTTLSYFQTPDVGTVITEDMSASFRVGDESNNFITCNFNIKFIKSTDLQITNCLSDQTFEVGNTCEFTVPDYTLTITANDPDAIITQSIPVGTEINNALPITITASLDGQTASCEFQLIPKDSINPVVICPGDQNETFNPENGFALPNYSLQAQATDNCTVAKIEQIPDVGTVIFENTEVSIRIEDIPGNFATCKFMVFLTNDSSGNTPPVANNNEYTTIQNQPYSEPSSGILSNDTDPEGDELTAVLKDTPMNGSLILDGNGSFLYTPNNNFVGQDFFTYIANDGMADSNIATVLINVLPINNTKPESVNDEYTVVENVTLEVSSTNGILANDTDAEDSTLTAILITNVANGVLNLNPNGSFSYTPNSSFTGVDTFTYVANDGSEDSNVAEVTITVIPKTNTAPISRDDIYSTSQDVTLTVITSSGVLSNDSDGEGEDLTAILISNVSFGTLTLNQDGSFVYNPNAGFFGNDSFTYSATDGSLNSDPATVRIEVVAVSGNTVTCRESVSLELNENGTAILNAETLFVTRPSDLQFSIDKENFICDDLGENRIILTYSNNVVQGSCEVLVLVKDVISPVVKVKDVTVALNEFRSVRITPEMVDNGSSDNCENITLSLDKLNFSCKELGENIVTFTVTDSSGNSSSATAIVTVTGNCDVISEPEVEHIFIYPNPTTGPFQFATPVGVTIQRVEAYDERGRLIMFKEFSEADLQYSMNLSGVQNAVYILKLFTSEGIEIKRVIIK